jgi:hypothetical protein
VASEAPLERKYSRWWQCGRTNSDLEKEMKKYSEDKFQLKSQLTPYEITQRLTTRTLKAKVLGTQPTDKDFIGQVDNNTFEFIDSTFFPIPYGGACVFKGTINQDSTISLVTTLHKLFRKLFIIWLIVMSFLFITFWTINSRNLNGLAAIIIGMPLISFLFRLFLHGMYVLGRNKGLSKMRRLLDVTK